MRKSQLYFFLITTVLLVGCTTKHGVAVYGWKSNVSISMAGDSTQEGFVEATTEAKASVAP